MELGSSRSGFHFLHSISHISQGNIQDFVTVEENSQGYGRSLFLLTCFFSHRKRVWCCAKVQSCVQPLSQGLHLHPLKFGAGPQAL